LLKEALILSKSLDSQGTYSWFTFVKNITSDQNIFDKTSNCKNLKKNILILNVAEKNILILVEEKKII
jgi:hypothetical protein